MHNWYFYRLAVPQDETLNSVQMRAAQSLDQSDYQRLAEFRNRLRGFLKFSEHEAAKIGLNPQQHQALLAIKGTPVGHVTIGTLAERLGIRHNSAVELITAKSEGPSKEPRVHA